MNKIATHNSGTGERSRNWISRLLTPFSCCQKKTLLEQYNDGCRLFDLRVNKSERLAHGLWESGKDAFDALNELNNVSDGKTYILLTMEGKYDISLHESFHDWRWLFTRLQFVAFCVKKPKWKTIETFITLEWQKEFSSCTWRKWIPFPKLWATLKKTEFNDNVFTMVDYL